MIRELKRELIDYIAENTGLDRKTVIKVLRAEEAYLMNQIRGTIDRERGR